ncbi:MAG TPA: signal peptidase II, partial [Patescibacteria group bacterium]
MNNRAVPPWRDGRRLFTPPSAGFIICTPLHPRGKPRGIRGQIIKAVSFDILFLLTVIVDQFIKNYFLKNPEVRDFLIETGFLKLTARFNQNYNLAFGIPLPRLLIISLMTAAIIILFSLLVKKLLAGRLFETVVILLIIYGAVSNLIDRIWHGFVIDYIDLIIVSVSWPVFNLADLMIVTGIILWLSYDLKKSPPP